MGVGLAAAVWFQGRLAVGRKQIATCIAGGWCCMERSGHPLPRRCAVCLGRLDIVCRGNLLMHVSFGLSVV